MKHKLLKLQGTNKSEFVRDQEVEMFLKEIPETLTAWTENKNQIETLQSFKHIIE